MPDVDPDEVRTWPLHAAHDDGGAVHLAAGTLLPDIALLTTNGARVNLRAVAGRAVVFVYPYTGQPGVSDPPAWDDIPGAHGSTPQALGFAATYAQFQQRGLRLYGLSVQSSDWQREAVARLKLPFELLSDASLAFADALRLPRFVTGGRSYLRRLSLFVRDGTVEGTIYPADPPEGCAEAALAWLDRTHRR